MADPYYNAAHLAYLSHLGGTTEDTAFPGSPTAGQLFSLLVDDTNGVEWLFRRNAANTKWRFQGGAALFVSDDNGGTTTSTTPVAISPALSISPPVSGLTYEIEFGARLTPSGAGTTAAYIALDGDTPTSIARAAFFAASVAGQGASVARKIRAAANTSIAMQHSTSAGTLTADRRWLAIRPVST